ncbi:MAG: hypothetical protein ACWGO1_01765 [Anaerolineales bacterium]
MTYFALVPESQNPSKLEGRHHFVHEAFRLNVCLVGPNKTVHTNREKHPGIYPRC